ncbi:MAG: pyroglutamyl-peptidase I [Candidatus Odinarchaeota archaeon]
MKILLTGFEPFGGSTVNPSIEACRRLKVTAAEYGLENHEIVVEEIKLRYKEIKDTITGLIEAVKPDILVMTGQAPFPSIRVEKLAVNLADARIAYNCGDKPVEEILEPDGFTAYFSTLPAKKIVEFLSEAGIPAVVSLSAGTYGCNQIFYHAMHHLQEKGSSITAGFIHVPALPEQVVDNPNTPSMSLSTIVKGLGVILNAITDSIG